MTKTDSPFRKLLKLSLPALFLSSIFLLYLFSLSLPAFGAGATLYLYPSSGTRYVDSYLSVYVLVNTGGAATNAYKAVITYPSDKLQVTSVSSGGSICSLWIPPSPSYANNQGTATFECGTPSAYNGASGRIGVVTFLIKGTGTATVSIADGSVKKADGQGTEILAAKRSATFALKLAPISAPEIFSSTHPDQNAWHQAKTVELSWTNPTGVDGFSYFLSQEPEGTPDNVSEGMDLGKTYPDLSDGVWYFHLKAHSTGGWSAPTHFRIQIDTQAPGEFEIVSDPPADNVDRAPTLSFTATDELSGIDYYEISIYGGDFVRTDSPYQFEWIYSGDQEIIVRAVDKAGNIREERVILKVKYVPPPTITSPMEGQTLPLFKRLPIKGTVTESGTVELLLDGQLLTQLEVNSPGFEHDHTEFLHPWEHKLSATLTTTEGIRSSATERNFRVDSKAISLFGIITLPGWLVYTLLILIILLLLILLILYLRRIRRERDKIKTGLSKAEKTLHKELDEMKEDLEKAVEETLQDGDDRRLRGMEHFLRKRIKEEDEEIQGEFQEELDKLKKRSVRKPRRKRLLARLKKKLKLSLKLSKKGRSSKTKSTR